MVSSAERDAALPEPGPGAQTITCLVADDHPAVSALLARYLAEEQITVVASVADGSQALTRAEATRPQVAVLDLRMPRLDGLEVARLLAGPVPETAVILYTGFGEEAALAEALDVGVRGFVQKDASLDELVRAIRVVAAGGTYLDPVLAARLARPTLPSLSKREREVLRLLADGLRYQEIGERLFLSSETVRSHTGKAMSKLNAATRVQPVAEALRLALIS